MTLLACNVIDLEQAYAQLQAEHPMAQYAVVQVELSPHGLRVGMYVNKPTPAWGYGGTVVEALDALQGKVTV